MKRNIGIGLDIGIGSVGFAVLSWTNRDDARIEDVGIRLFDSGEKPRVEDGKNRKSQDRREARAGRRLVRRRHHRKERAKKFLERIHLISQDKLKIWQEKNGNQKVWETRLKGLSEKLSPEEIADCIIHICNHRGYREFYEDDDKENKIKDGLDAFENKYHDGKYSSIAEMVLNDEEFKTTTAFPDFHNHKDQERYMLIKRSYNKSELENILKKQQEYYPKQLTDDNIRFLVDKIVFAQRDFEDGPGDKDDKDRKYMGFLDTLGQCMFYKDERRAFRTTIIADIYALINCLSQYAFVDMETGEIVLYPDAAKKIVQFALENAGITEKDLKAILKKYNVELVKPGKLQDAIGKSFKVLKVLKRTLEECGYSYSELIAEDQFDLKNPSRLQQLCVAMSENITPRRRKDALKRLGWNAALQDALVRQKFGGTASVSEKYMVESIAAFCDGETYGNFQARRNKEKDEQITEDKKYDLLPPITKNIANGGDDDLVKNVVVFKAINETRKVINALIRKHGTPEYINIEVADELGKSVQERNEISKHQKDNQKDYDKIEQLLVELKLRKEGEVRPNDVARYRLWRMQKGIDLYTGKRIEENDVLNPRYEVDHIVPFSLILDDTLQNKALVDLGSNRALKGQQVPLEFLKGEEKDTFKKNVNELLNKKLISQKKYQYLMMESLNTDKAREILAEWKSRNINDTRYITRYITNYLAANLKFAGDRQKHVFAVKGVITSKMRRLWLNKKSWGNDEKNRDNNLHHAADAIVIANLTPATLELASDNIKLNRILKSNHMKVNGEYSEYLDRAVRKMQKYYGMNGDYVRDVLSKTQRVPSMIKELAKETDIRLTDPTLEYYQNNNVNQAQFEANVKAFYQDDCDFAASIHMPLVSYKQDKRFQGELSNSQYIKRSEKDNTSIVKIDTLGNENVLNGKKYYCLEIYLNQKGATCVRGLRYVDFKKSNKKLMLVKEYPEDYKLHVMYLFKNDYIVIHDSKGSWKFKGYYQSIKVITRGQFYMKFNNNSDAEIVSIAKKDRISKYNIDLLGNIGGEIKCSEPFMSLPKNE